MTTTAADFQGLLATSFVHLRRFIDYSVPLTTQSNFLNVTVFVQGKEARSTTDRKQVAAAALLDTDRLAGDFIAMHVIDALNAHDLCYIASKVLSVCSGLNHACYANKMAFQGVKAEISVKRVS